MKRCYTSSHLTNEVLFQSCLRTGRITGGGMSGAKLLRVEQEIRARRTDQNPMSPNEVEAIERPIVSDGRV